MGYPTKGRISLLCTYLNGKNIESMNDTDEISGVIGKALEEKRKYEQIYNLPDAGAFFRKEFRSMQYRLCDIEREIEQIRSDMEAADTTDSEESAIRALSAEKTELQRKVKSCRQSADLYAKRRIRENADSLYFLSDFISDLRLRKDSLTWPCLGEEVSYG